ncbi:MAG: histidinol dehydrogenase [Actinobacteria bacterium]|nr:histidinol dehydrogenase [Actinomycetota bacterium]
MGLYNFLKITNVNNPDEINSWLKRDAEINSSVIKTVNGIINDIKKNGDTAVIKYSRKFDGLDVQGVPDLRVKKGEIDSAGRTILAKNSGLVKALEKSYSNIRRYHLSQFRKEPKSWFIAPAKNKKLGQILNPIERIGIYVPGGRYLYPSSILMAAVPARIAGVKEIVVCTPPQKDGKINDIFLYLFSRLGIKEIYKIGGAQAIAAMAYGTVSIKKVDKIVGPGNVFVTAAKKMVYGEVGIDSLAGPSEIVVIADDKANPAFAAADLLSQAEHDLDAKSILLTTSADVGRKVIEEIYKQLKKLIGCYGSRIDKGLLESSLRKNCMVFLNSNMNFIINLCNLIAPEHLEIMTTQNEKILGKIKNAGAIFIGDFTPVAVGDYIGGTNHIIPTNGNARFSSPLGVYDFMKKSSVTFYGKEAFKGERKFIESISDFENLLAHNNSIKIRLIDTIKVKNTKVDKKTSAKENSDKPQVIKKGEIK